MCAIALVLIAPLAYPQTTEPAAADRTAKAALEQLAIDLASRSIATFSKDLDAARAVMQSMAEGEERNTVRAAVANYEDVLAVWYYRTQTPIGSFFDDQSSGGLFTRLTQRYPDYASFIRPYGVRANSGRSLYPTAETLQYLANRAAVVVASVAAASAVPVTRLPAAPQSAPVTTPSPPRQPTAAPQPAPEAKAAAQPTSIPAAPVRVSAPGSCADLATLDAIELTSDGLVLRASSPISARIMGSREIAESGFEGFTIVTVEVPFADLGTAPSRLTSVEGPFTSMRAVRFRSGSDCGVRIRLETREPGGWTVQTTGNTLTVGIPKAIRLATAAAAAREGTQTNSGSAHVSASYFGSSGNIHGASGGGQTQVSFATTVGAAGVLRGFVASTYPQRVGAGSYGALAFSGFQVDRHDAEIAAGDLSFSLAGDGATIVNQLLIRGFGAAYFWSPRSTMQVFGGRAATSSLRRIFEEGETADLSRDHVYGVTQQWLASNDRSGFSIGWAHSIPRNGRPAEDLLESFESSLGRAYGFRATAEESVSRDTGETLFGYAWTIEPRAVTRRLSLNGFYRYTSPDFRPPLASSFFAGLRRSYSLAGSYQASDRLSVSAALGQTKSFSVFDPETSGTVATSAGSTIAYVLGHGLSAMASYSESSLRSDPGVLAAANSQTTGASAGLYYSHGRTGIGVDVARNRTVDRISNQLNFESTRFDLNATHAVRDDLQFIGRAYVGNAKRISGEGAGADYGASLSAELLGRNSSAFRAEAGYTATPSGITAEPTKQFYASVGYSPGSRFPLFQGGAQLTFQSLQVNGFPARNAVWFSVNAARLLEWGAVPHPRAPYETRALQIGEMAPILPNGRIEIFAFEDRNANGLFDPGETPVPGIGLTIDGRELSTDTSGMITASVPRGLHRVHVGPSAVAKSYVTMQPLDSVELRPAERKELRIALVPAGRLVGRLVFTGANPDPAFLTGVRVVARGSRETREIVATSSGELPFGLLPVGEYTVEVDLRTLAPETRLTSPSAVVVRIRHGDRTAVTFTVRRATLRERFGTSR